MVTQLDPIIGNWYQQQESGQTFEVVAVDADEGTVDIQHFDGDIEELSVDGWYQLDIESSEPPEDWTGAIDDVMRDNLGFTDMEMRREDWFEPLEEAKPTWRSAMELPDELEGFGPGYADEEPWVAQE